MSVVIKFHLKIFMWDRIIINYGPCPQSPCKKISFHFHFSVMSLISCPCETSILPHPWLGHLCSLLIFSLRVLNYSFDMWKFLSIANNIYLQENILCAAYQWVNEDICKFLKKMIHLQTRKTVECQCYHYLDIAIFSSKVK